MKVQNASSFYIKEPQNSADDIQKELRTKRAAAYEMQQALQTEKPKNFDEYKVKESPASEMNYQFIVAKLRSGQELSSYELSILKKKDPALHGRAVKAQKARIELRQRLERAKSTKDFEAARAAVASLATATIPLTGSSSGDPFSTEPFTDEFSLAESALRNEFSKFNATHDKVAIQERIRKLEEQKRKEK